MSPVLGDRTRPQQFSSFSAIIDDGALSKDVEHTKRRRSVKKMTRNSFANRNHLRTDSTPVNSSRARISSHRIMRPTPDLTMTSQRQTQTRAPVGQHRESLRLQSSFLDTLCRKPSLGGMSHVQAQQQPQQQHPLLQQLEERLNMEENQLCRRRVRPSSSPTNLRDLTPMFGGPTPTQRPATATTTVTVTVTGTDRAAAPRAGCGHKVGDKQIEGILRLDRAASLVQCANADGATSSRHRLLLPMVKRASLDTHSGVDKSTKQHHQERQRRGKKLLAKTGTTSGTESSSPRSAIALLEDLPDDLLLEILLRLPARSIGLVAQINWRWRVVCNDEQVWKRLYDQFVGTNCCCRHPLDPLQARPAPCQVWRARTIQRYQTSRHWGLLGVGRNQRSLRCPPSLSNVRGAVDLLPANVTRATAVSTCTSALPLFNSPVRSLEYSDSGDEVLACGARGGVKVLKIEENRENGGMRLSTCGELDAAPRAVMNPYNIDGRGRGPGRVGGDMAGAAFFRWNNCPSSVLMCQSDGLVSLWSKKGGSGETEESDYRRIAQWVANTANGEEGQVQNQQDLVTSFATLKTLGGIFVTGHQSGQVLVWEVSREAVDGQHRLSRVSTLEGHTDEVRSVKVFSVFSECTEGEDKGVRIVSASKDGTIRIWRIDGERGGRSAHTTTTATHILTKGGKSKTSSVWEVDVDRRRGTVVAAFGDATISRWDVEPTTFKSRCRSQQCCSSTHKQMDNNDELYVRGAPVEVPASMSWRAHAQSTTAIRCLEDEGIIISGSNDKGIKSWTREGNLLSVVEMSSLGSVLDKDHNAQNAVAVDGDEGGGRQAAPIDHRHTPFGMVRAVECAYTRGLLFCGLQDGTIKVVRCCSANATDVDALGKPTRDLIMSRVRANLLDFPSTNSATVSGTSADIVTLPAHQVEAAIQRLSRPGTEPRNRAMSRQGGANAAPLNAPNGDVTQKSAEGPRKLRYFDFH